MGGLGPPGGCGRNGAEEMGERLPVLVGLVTLHLLHLTLLDFLLGLLLVAVVGIEDGFGLLLGHLLRLLLLGLRLLFLLLILRILLVLILFLFLILLLVLILLLILLLLLLLLLVLLILLLILVIILLLFEQLLSQTEVVAGLIIARIIAQGTLEVVDGLLILLGSHADISCIIVCLGSQLMVATLLRLLGSIDIVTKRLLCLLVLLLTEQGVAKVVDGKRIAGIGIKSRAVLDLGIQIILLMIERVTIARSLSDLALGKE